MLTLIVYALTGLFKFTIDDTSRYFKTPDL
jgi:hypothetical protein